jgi:hypothetical protein
MKITVELDRDQAETFAKLLRRLGPRELEELLDDAGEAQTFTAASDRLRLAILDASEPHP